LLNLGAITAGLPWQGMCDEPAAHPAHQKVGQ